MKSRWWWLVVAAVVVVGAVAWVIAEVARPGQGGPTAPAPAATGIAALPAVDADRIESNLESGDRKRILESLTVPAGTKVDQKLFSGLKALGDITIREDSAVLLDDHSVRVYADVQNGATKTWTLLLTNVDGTWRVSATLEGEQQ